MNYYYVLQDKDTNKYVYILKPKVLTDDLSIALLVKPEEINNSKYKNYKKEKYFNY